MKRPDQFVNFFRRVVKSQGRTHRSLKAEETQHRLGAVVPRAYRYSLGIEERPYLLVAAAVQNKREDACFFRGRTDEAEAPDFFHFRPQSPVPA